MHKLKKRYQFLRVYKKGKFFKGYNILLNILENDIGYNRLGISVESRRVPLSVSRNRCKRLVLESYRLSENLLKKGYDIVLKLKNDISKFRLTAVEKEVSGLYKKAGILRLTPLDPTRSGRGKGV